MTRFRRRRFTSNPGFTLVEVMVATFMMSIAGAAIYILIGTLIRTHVLSEHMATATTLAQAKVDELRAADYATISNGQDVVTGFRREWTIAPYANLHAKAVRATVSWEHLDGRTLNSHLVSVIAGPEE